VHDRSTDGSIFVNPYVLLILIALLYAFLVGGLGALRREGFSLQFVVEVLVAGGGLMALSLLAGSTLHPVLFLVLLYLITMRVRLLVDLANVLARRGSHAQAAGLYATALKLRPDSISRLVVRLNQGVHLLKQDRLQEAVALLGGLLGDSTGNMAPKLEAGVRYNLAVAYHRRGDEAKAIAEFNQVIDVMPGSLYAVGAQKALERGRQRKEPAADADE
jgi:tetratricopeptide (TPR) repeat protein